MKPAIKPGLLAVIAIYICSCVGLYVVCHSEVSAMDETVLPAPIPRGRWKEDWSILPVPDLTLDDPLLFFKRVPLNESGTNYMSFGGEYRLAYEIYDPVDRGLSDIGKQDVVLNRFAAHADWHPNERWRVFGQLGFATSGDREGGDKVGDESDLNIWQLFVDYRFKLKNSEHLDVRLGRQFIEKADWFIGSGEARNVRQYYDGLRTAWLNEGFAKFDAFAAEFVDAATGSFEMSGMDEYFWGASAGFRLGDPQWKLSLHYFGWDLKDRQFQQGGGQLYDETRHSVVFKFQKPVAVTEHWAMDYYLVYQFGKYDDPKGSDIKAYSAFGEFKYAFYTRMETPIVGLKTSYFSGDDDPNDNELNTFYNPIFVTVYFSYARDVMPYNLLHLQPNIAYRFSEKLQLTLSNDYLWRASNNDAFYTAANKIGVPAEESDADFIGTQVQLATLWKPTKHIVASLYIVRYWAGELVTDAGGGNQNYLRAEFSYLL